MAEARYYDNRDLCGSSGMLARDVRVSTVRRQTPEDGSCCGVVVILS